MDLFKKQSVLSWIALTATTLLLTCNAVVQILYMNEGISALAKVFIPLTLVIGALSLLRDKQISHVLQDNPAQIIAGCFCTIILIVLNINAHEVVLSLYPVYTVFAVIMFSVTAQICNNRFFSGCCFLWVETAILCLLAGLTNDYESVFAVCILGTVISIIFCIHSDKTVFTKGVYVVILCMIPLTYLSVSAFANDKIIDYIVDHLYPLEFWHIDGRLPSLDQFVFIGSSKTFDPLNDVLAFAAGNWGIIAVIGISILMSTLTVCAFATTKGKNGINRYLHIGSTIVLLLSFVSNILYVCGIGTLVTKNAAFFNANLQCLIGEAIMLVAILHYEPATTQETEKSEATNESSSTNHDLNLHYDLATYPLAVSQFREYLIDYFIPKEDDIFSEEGDVAAALDNTEQCVLIRYQGHVSNISNALKFISIPTEHCFVRVHTGVDTDIIEHCGILESVFENLPENTTTCVRAYVPSYAKGECLLCILAV